jgi:hypothetical protein
MFRGLYSSLRPVCNLPKNEHLSFEVLLSVQSIDQSSFDSYNFHLSDPTFALVVLAKGFLCTLRGLNNYDRRAEFRWC